MEQVIVGGYYDALHTSSTEYNLAMGGYLWGTDPDDFAITIAAPGKIKNLRVKLNDTPGSGSYTFTLYHHTGSWGDSSLTCTVGSAATEANDLVNEVTVSAGDLICIKCAPSSPGSARYARWSFMFEGDNSAESLMGCIGFASSTTTYYLPIQGFGYRSTMSEMEQVMPTSGTLRDLYVHLENDPGVSPDAFEFTLMKNGVAQSLQVTITADAVSGNDTSNTVTVAAGDKVCIRSVPKNSPLISSYASIGMTFVADTDGESCILGGTYQNLNRYVTAYDGHATAVQTWSTTEAQRYQLAQACTLKKLYVYITAAPGSGNTWTFTVRKNGASPGSGLSVTISNPDTSGNDTSNTISVSDADDLDMMCVPVSIPALADGYYSMVCYIEAAGGEEKGPVNSSVIIGVVASASRSTGMDRDSSVIIGDLVSASRTAGYDIDSSVIIGNLVSASKSREVTKSSIVLIGILVTALRAISTVRSASVLIGDLVSASKFRSVSKSASVLIGDLVSASRALDASRDSSVSIGDLVSGYGAAGANKISSVLIGNLVSASRSAAVSRSSSISLGVVASVSRLIAASRSSSVSIGELVSADRIFGKIVSSSVTIGVLVSALRIVGYINSAMVLIGNLVSASGSQTTLRSSSVLIGVLTTADRSGVFSRSASVLIGDLVSASGISSTGFIKTASVSIGVLVSASRIYGRVRSASVLIGLSVAASVIGRIRKIRKRSDFYNLGKIKTTPHDLGAIQEEYTLEEGGE